MIRILLPIALLLTPELFSQDIGQFYPGPPPAETGNGKEAASVAGKVLSAATGEPLKRVRLLLAPLDGNAGRTFTAVTDAEGVFVMNGVVADRYRLTAERTGFVHQEYGARRGMRIGVPLTVAAGQAITNLEFKLQPHGVITGRVVDEDGEPLAHVYVTTLQPRFLEGRRQFIAHGSAQTNDLGEYRIFGLAPGRYLLGASVRMPNRIATSEEIYTDTYYPQAAQPSGATQLQVTTGKVITGIDLRMLRSRSVRISGRVHHPDTAGAGKSADPNPTMLLLIRSSETYVLERNSTLAYPDGSFEMTGVLPGSYFLVAIHSSSDVQKKARVDLTVGNADVTGIELRLVSWQEVTGKLNIEGHSHDSSADLRVFLEPVMSVRNGSGGEMVSIKEDGTFTLKYVDPDTYRVRLSSAKNSWYPKSVFLGNREAPNGEIVITPGDSSELTITASNAVGELTGAVRNDGKAADKATVVLAPDDEQRQKWREMYKVSSVDAQGRYRLEGIVPGTYRVYAFDSVEHQTWMDPQFLQMFEGKARKVTIREHGKETVDLELIKNDEGEGNALP